MRRTIVILIAIAALSGPAVPALALIGGSPLIVHLVGSTDLRDGRGITGLTIDGIDVSAKRTDPDSELLVTTFASFTDPKGTLVAIVAPRTEAGKTPSVERTLDGTTTAAIAGALEDGTKLAFTVTVEISEVARSGRSTLLTTQTTTQTVAQEHAG